MRRFAAFVTILMLALSHATNAQDAIIGEVLGKPVYAGQIKSTTNHDRASLLRSVLISPAISAYLKRYKEDISLTEAESRFIIDSYNALRKCKPEIGLTEMKPPFDKAFAQMIGGGTKAQRFIYLDHGRGRILFQQAGMEAFDATYRLILHLEEKGDIRFSSKEDRTLALSYWATQNHSSFLKPDPGVDKAFLLEGLMSQCE